LCATVLEHWHPRQCHPPHPGGPKARPKPAQANGLRNRASDPADKPHRGATTYAGLRRRIGKALTNRGDLDPTEWYYYSGQRQIEARNGSGQTTRQYVWGTQYIDEIVREDINGNPAADNLCVGSTGDAAYYYHQDANYNVTAVTDLNGDGVQRISYSAYGRPSFTDSSGRSRAAPTFGPPAGPYAIGNQLHTAALAWQGLFNDLETGHSYNRARTLDHRLGRFMQRDPLGYIDGMSLYQYVSSRPTGVVDPWGTNVVPGSRPPIPGPDEILYWRCPSFCKPFVDPDGIRWVPDPRGPFLCKPDVRLCSEQDAACEAKVKQDWSGFPPEVIVGEILKRCRCNAYDKYFPPGPQPTPTPDPTLPQIGAHPATQMTVAQCIANHRRCTAAVRAEVSRKRIICRVSSTAIGALCAPIGAGAFVCCETINHAAEEDMIEQCDRELDFCLGAAQSGSASGSSGGGSPQQRQ